MGLYRFYERRGKLRFNGFISQDVFSYRVRDFPVCGFRIEESENKNGLGINVYLRV
jgi:hypothetical protein